MKIQTELISYLIFVVILITISSFLIFYFGFLSSHISKNINKINLYSLLNVFESPILIFNSVCDFCKVNYIFQINFSLPSYSIYYISFSDDYKIKYEELYSSSVIHSNLFNYTYFFALNISASSASKIFFEFNKFENKIIFRNI